MRHGLPGSRYYTPLATSLRSSAVAEVLVSGVDVMMLSPLAVITA